jgi:hypothetical protein
MGSLFYALPLGLQDVLASGEDGIPKNLVTGCVRCRQNIGSLAVISSDG